jgi:hypothetical protein
MFHVYGVSVTPNKVVLALVGLYFTCKSFKFFGSLLIPPKFHPAPPPAPPPALVSVNVPFFRPHLSIPPFYIVLRGESGDLYWLDRQLPPWLCSSFGVHVDFRFFPSVRRGLPAPVFYIGDSKPVSTPFFTRDNDDRFVLIYPQALLPQTHLPQTQICSSVLSLPSIPEEMEVE